MGFVSSGATNEAGNKSSQDIIGRYLKLLEIAPSITYIAKYQNRFLTTFISGNTKQKLGYEPDQILADADFWERKIHPEDMPKIKDVLSRLDRIEHAEHEYRLKAADDSWKWIREELTLTKDDNGAPLEIMGALTDITELKITLQELEHRAYTDYLTGLLNRRHFMSLAEVELTRAMRYQNNFSVLMMDIDHFKKINDEHGHHIGDKVLQTFSNICKLTLRDIDVIGRVGGEEFAVLLPETDIEHAIQAAQRLRKAVAAEGIMGADGIFNVTVSIGVTSLILEEEDNTFETLLIRADSALYAAKHAGRNAVRASFGQPVKSLHT
ncbi:MAG TPA: sensor domain-containing diguanylate cyclase [Methylophilaceae bacterium]